VSVSKRERQDKVGRQWWVLELPTWYFTLYEVGCLISQDGAKLKWSGGSREQVWRGLRLSQTVRDGHEMMPDFLSALGAKAI